MNVILTTTTACQVVDMEKTDIGIAIGTKKTEMMMVHVDGVVMRGGRRVEAIVIVGNINMIVGTEMTKWFPTFVIGRGDAAQDFAVVALMNVHMGQLQHLQAWVLVRSTTASLVATLVLGDHD